MSLLIDIEITWRIEEEIHPDYQEWHERFISNFKTTFEKWIKGSGVRCAGIIAINLYYYPDQQKFSIKSILRAEHYILDSLKKDIKFSNQYFI